MIENLKQKTENEILGNVIKVYQERADEVTELIETNYINNPNFENMSSILNKREKKVIADKFYQNAPLTALVLLPQKTLNNCVNIIKRHYNQLVNTEISADEIILHLQALPEQIASAAEK